MTKIDAGAATAKPPRQAIVLIHGIGEQRPLATLRRFVAAFLETETYYSKPDTISDSYELRRFKLRRAAEGPGTPLPINDDWPETDFYEYYWAHHMYGTKVSHVIRWFLRVLWGSREYLRLGTIDYPPLRRLVVLTWLAVLAVVGLAIYLWGHRDAIPYIGEIQTLGIGAAVVAALFFLARQIMQFAMVDFLGDAARYFDVNPKNVARRYDILRSGIEILRKLHEDCDKKDAEIMYRYGRIVLVGHSLGSVIAYDILQHYWHDINDRLDVSGLDFSEVENYSGSNGRPDFARAEPYCDLKEFRASQHRAWLRVNEDARSGVRLPLSSARKRWLVSDLVTLGSPLAHAPLLMADGLKDFGERKWVREFSTCPPSRSRHLNPGRFTVPLRAEADRITNHPILHQGAYFALTRWTNFYFRNDPVGGPLTVPFGDGIEDVELKDGPWLPPSAHTGYWRGGKGSKAVQRLGKILRGEEV